MATRLPLFPLNTVLVPGLVLPLHVFEPRYRVLVQALLELPDEAERRFGVVAIRSGREVGADGARALHAVGCTAELREVTPYADGRFDLVTVGETRFRLTGLDEAAGTPYHTGLVEFLPERDGDGDVTALTHRVTARFAEYRERLGVDVTELPEQPQVVSYLVAAAVVLDLPDRQALLEQPTTADRLRAELELLRREVALVGAFRSLPAVDLAAETGSAN
ncbi:MAG TPA: LON peptidase substrate-binding domain-containing protein [Kineosporiaceae bacterium]|nr:LON peptidase substrate-binding domain-containing protein [Kineosporiaceae bacterium]